MALISETYLLQQMQQLAAREPHPAAHTFADLMGRDAILNIRLRELRQRAYFISHRRSRIHQVRHTPRSAPPRVAASPRPSAPRTPPRRSKRIRQEEHGS